MIIRGKTVSYKYLKYPSLTRMKNTKQPTAIAYSVSKWAVRGLTQATAVELAPHQINVRSRFIRDKAWENTDLATG